MPSRPRRKTRRRTRDSYPGSMIARYMRSPYDPDNSRNFWGYTIARTIGSPPRHGAGRWFAWLMALSFITIAAVSIYFGLVGDPQALLLTIVFGIVGVVLLLRLLSRTPR